MTEITLDELLLSRDERRQHQQKLLSEYKGMTLICLTVVMPGKVKRNRFSLTVADCAVKEITDGFASHIYYKEEKDLQTGFEAYFITDIPVKEAKRICCTAEENHELGRLFDIDVIDAKGIPVSREELGFGKRKCLLCDNEARYCMRNFSHTQEEIQSHIAQMIDNYIRKQQNKQ